MATDKQLDSAISGWLEEQASGQLPDRVLRATFERTRRNRQQAGWRALLGRTQMPRFILALSGAAAVVTAAVLALTLFPRQPGVGGPPTQSPTASPSPASLTERFDSTIHGISVHYPADWQARPATEPGTGGELSFDSPAADVSYDPARGDGLYLVLASQPYGSASEDVWRDDVLAWTCPDGMRDFGGWSVDGAYAEHGGPCNSGVIVQADTRGYLIRLVASSDEPGLADRYDWDWLKPMLATVDLRPEEAVDAPRPSASP